ncbi:MAG: zinc-binding dehydrogenase [Sphingomonadaceae bacterium]|nr:zinc-binding dehydrogenase [Sphingomonadaceae bacterium]MCP5390850.1 zinc-binding dehydrogenase [Sphingomonadaceae bacterium]MCP5394606.1 zinc-binding dehydrogenase [Sphingomonadaceae bacterium]
MQKGTMMEAVLIERFGGPEVLELRQVERPKPGPDEVLVQVAAVSVNQSFDLSARRGKSIFPLKLPLQLGVDPVGTIVEVGENVDAGRIGERVFSTFIVRCRTCDNCRAERPCSSARQIGITSPGGYAQYLAVPAFQARRIPDSIEAGVACVIGRHGEAAWSEIESADVQAGEWVLIMGASGGLGSLLVQLAKMRGANVIAVVGSEARAWHCMRLGADHTVNYRSGDLPEQVRQITGPAGVNVVFENVSNPATFPQAFASLAPGGRLVTIGYHGGKVVPLDVSVLFRNRLTVKSAPMWMKDSSVFDECFRLAAEGKLKGTVAQRFPLREAAKAHGTAERGHLVGKIILEP